MAQKKYDNCPECNAKIPVPVGFTKWCPNCDWNLGEAPIPPQGLKARIYADYGKKSGKALFEKLRSNEKRLLKASLSPSKIIAFLMAGLVHAFTLAVLGLGLYLVFFDWFNAITLLFGSIFVAAGVFLLPSFGKRPETGTLTREQAPVLYAFVDEVADELSTKRIDLICLSDEINASYSTFGFPKKSLLTLGTPLWFSLDSDQKTALIAHELSHQVNGDSSRGLWLGLALNSLDFWYEFLSEPIHEDPSFGEILAKLAMRPFSWLVFTYGKLLIHIYWYDSQKAEYLADYLGGKVSGTDEFVSLNSRIALVTSHYNWLIAKLRKHHRDKEKIIPAFTAELQDVPDTEVERVNRLLERELTTLDSTHPSTFFRNKMLVEFPGDPKIVMPKETEAKIDKEISQLDAVVASMLIQTHFYELE